MDQSTEYYAKIGRKAVRLGLQMAHNIIDDVLRELDRVEQTEAEHVVIPARSRRQKQLKGPAGYWARFTPEERSIEMKRRLSLGSDKKVTKSPETISKLRKAAKASWANLTPAQRKARSRKMKAGHAAAKEAAGTPTVRMLREQGAAA